MEGKNSNTCRILSFVAGGVALMVITAIVTGLVTKSLWGNSCGTLTFSKKPEWDRVTRLDIPDRGLTVSRLVSDNQCFIMPSGVSDTKGLGRPLVVDDQPMGFSVIEHVAGPDAASFCQGYQTYMVREFKPEELERPKRDSYGAGGAPAGGAPAGGAPAGGAPPPAGGAPPPAGGAPPPAGGAPPPAGGAPAGGSAADLAAKVPVLTGARVEGDGIFGGAKDPGKPAVDLTMDERQPRCNKIILDCVEMVGKVQSCWTWQNGRVWMDRKCEEPTKFVMRMTKPPGRILKIAQQESILCLQRHKENKEC